MGHHIEAFVGIDTAKLRNAVAEGGCNSEVCFVSEIDNTEAATRKLIRGRDSAFVAELLDQAEQTVTS